MLAVNPNGIPAKAAINAGHAYVGGSFELERNVPSMINNTTNPPSCKPTAGITIQRLTSFDERFLVVGSLYGL